MYLRSLDIPMLDWIDDMLGMTQFKFKGETDEEQFQSALRAMVVTTYVLFKAGYFLGLPKCNLIPEQVVTYLGIDCDSKHEKFLVPEKRVIKYIALLQNMLTKTSVSFSEVEKMVGKLVSLECAVTPGMWDTRHQYAAMTSSGIKPDAKKVIKNNTRIYVTLNFERNGTCGSIFYCRIKDLHGRSFQMFMFKLMFPLMLLEEPLQV